MPTRQWASAEGSKTGICPLEIGPKNQNFLKNLKSATQFRLVNLILAMTIYLQGRGKYAIESFKLLHNKQIAIYYKSLSVGCL